MVSGCNDGARARRPERNDLARRCTPYPTPYPALAEAIFGPRDPETLLPEPVAAPEIPKTSKVLTPDVFKLDAPVDSALTKLLHDAQLRLAEIHASLPALPSTMEWVPEFGPFDWHAHDDRHPDGVITITWRAAWKPGTTMNPLLSED